MVRWKYMSIKMDFIRIIYLRRTHRDYTANWNIVSKSLRGQVSPLGGFRWDEDVPHRKVGRNSLLKALFLLCATPAPTNFYFEILFKCTEKLKEECGDSPYPSPCVNDLYTHRGYCKLPPPPGILVRISKTQDTFLYKLSTLITPTKINISSVSSKSSSLVQNFKLSAKPCL